MPLPWFDYLAYFFGGLFLINAAPHLVSGLTGRPFQTPFAKPPGRGLSSSTVNALWGFFNLAVAYALIARVGVFNLRDTLDTAAAGLGMLAGGLFLAWNFGKLHGGNFPSARH